MTRIPIIPTIIVVVAAATMVGLGIWQLGRADEKAKLLAEFAQAQQLDALVPYPQADGENWFRRSVATCTAVLSQEAVSGTAQNGAKGWAHRARCTLESGAEATVDIGFSQSPNSPEWSGGTVSGRIAPGPRLVADPPVADLYPLAKPDPAELPDNHLAYAFQWFFFALTAIAIYGFALRSRMKKRD